MEVAGAMGAVEAAVATAFFPAEALVLAPVTASVPVPAPVPAPGRAEALIACDDADADEDTESGSSACVGGFHCFVLEVLWK